MLFLFVFQREFNDECVFNEMMELNHYNTYSSTKYSNQRRTQYIAINNKGLPRRVLIKAKTPLGKLSAYTRILTQSVMPSSGVNQRKHVCPPPPQSQSGNENESPRCKRKKKKKKRRRCPEKSRRPCKLEDDIIANENGGVATGSGEGTVKKPLIIRRKCEEENCRTKKLHMIGRKRKSRHGSSTNNTRISLHHGHHPPAQPDGHSNPHQHAIKRTRHLHHLRHVHQPPPIDDQDDDDSDDHELVDNDDDDDEEEEINNNNHHHFNLLTTNDPNNGIDVEEITTDQQLIQLLDTNDK